MKRNELKTEMLLAFILDEYLKNKKNPFLCENPIPIELKCISE